MSERHFKWLAERGRPAHGGTGKWSLPNGKPGRWKHVRGELVPCENGIHLCRGEHLLAWVAPTLYEAEYGGQYIDNGDKVVVRKARLTRHLDGWTAQTARLFAADCAESVLYLFEQERPNDARPRDAIKTARAFAHGNATREELAAARDAARDAAWDAARAAQSRRLARMFNEAHRKALQ